MSKFTPGTWEAKEWACHAATTVMSGDIVVAECSGHGRNSVDSIADANLIAAAPEMYEALKKMRDSYLHDRSEDFQDRISDFMVAASLALAKADGGTK